MVAGIILEVKIQQSESIYYIFIKVRTLFHGYQGIPNFKYYLSDSHFHMKLPKQTHHLAMYKQKVTSPNNCFLFLHKH